MNQYIWGFLVLICSTSCVYSNMCWRNISWKVPVCSVVLELMMTDGFLFCSWQQSPNTSNKTSKNESTFLFISYFKTSHSESKTVNLTVCVSDFSWFWSNVVLFLIVSLSFNCICYHKGFFFFLRIHFKKLKEDVKHSLGHFFSFWFLKIEFSFLVSQKLWTGL